MKILVTGAEGQVGATLTALAATRDIPVEGLGRSVLDITDERAVFRAVATGAPGVVVNAAAFTAVDRAEAAARDAFAVNREGARNVARACARTGAMLVHLSTDYVFDGRKQDPYLEEDEPNPLGVYGLSKWEGEEAVRQVLPDACILRTSWVFGGQGPNFPRTILRLAREREEIRVVADQHGRPTEATDLAQAILSLSERCLEAPLGGTYHFAGEPPTTWFGFAKAIVETAAARDASYGARVVPISSEEYPTAAPRPGNSVLAVGKIEAVFGIRPGDWRAALSRIVESVLRGD